MTSAYDQFAAMHDMNNPAAVAQYNASQGITSAPQTTLQKLSIGLANGSITNQAGVNQLYGNESYGSAVPEANATTTRNTGSPITPVAKTQQQLDADSGAHNPYGYTSSGARIANPNAQNVTGTTQNSLQNAGGGSGYSRYGGGGGSDSTAKAEDYLNTFEAPQSDEEIKAQQLRDAQGQIDALNKYNESLMLDQSRVNDIRSAETNAQSVLSGLSGSSEASNRRVQTEGINQSDNAKLLAAHQVDLQGIYRQVQKDARDEIDRQRKNARESALGIRDHNTALKTENETKANNYAQTLSKAGLDLNKIKTSDPQTYQWMAQAVGGEDMLKALWTLNIPKESIIDKKVEGGKYIIAYQKPDGSVRIETLDLNLPANYTSSADLGDRVMFYDPKDPSKHVFYNKGLTPDQAAKNGAGGGLDGVPPDIAAAAQAIFDGRSKLTEFPSAKRLAINAASLKLYDAEGGNQLAQGAYDSAVALASNKGLAHAVGSNALLGFGKNIPGTASAGFLAELDKLKANLKLVNIKYLRGTGALSDAEGKTLEDASTSLNASLPEAQFKTELERVTKALAKAKGIKTTDTGSSGSSSDSPAKGVDGASYGYPGYVSDGTQWVLKQ